MNQPLPPAALRFIGQPVPQLDAPAKVAGEAVYAGDIALAGMLHCAILRSPHPHALLRAIDVSAARALPGVHAVVTGKDCPQPYINFGPVYADRYPLAVDKVRFTGEEVVAVAADSPAIAHAALALVRIDYQVLPAALDVDAALASGAPEIHQRSGLPQNVAQHTQADFGDVAGGFARAAHVLDGVFEHGVVVPACMETNAVVASFDQASGDLSIWAPTQAPFFVKKELAHVLGLAPERVHVRSVVIGGGFGGKSQAPETVAIAALLAVQCRAPVRLVLTRREEFMSGKTDHGKRMRAQIAVDADGNILARRTDYTVDNGAYTHMGPAYISAVRQRTCNLYRTAAAGFDGRLVYTNKVPGGSYRGMGAPQIIWALETQIDQIAELLGKDKLAYRIQIANQPGDETPQGWKLSTCAMRECLAEAGRLVDWERRRHEKCPGRGIGFAAMINPSVGVLYPEGNFANVSIDLQEDGLLLVGTQTADAGTGQNTVLAQFVAEELQIPLEQVRVLHMDTDKTPPDLGSAASRVTFVSGAAAIEAGRVLRRDLQRRFAARWNVAAEDIEVSGGFVCAPGQAPLDFAGVAALEGPIRIEGRHEINLPRADPKTGYGHYAPAYGFGAQAVEVEVDTDTGHVRVLKVVVVQDMGRVINPLALEGQMHGGIVQGIGMALREELVFDHGAPVNASFITYKVPRAMETPEIITRFIETLDPSGPLGAKAGGEHSINPTIAAIANAVADAIGVRFTSLPITPAKVLAALAERRAEKLALQPWREPMNLEVAAVRKLYPVGLFPAMQSLGRAVGRKREPVAGYTYEMADSPEDAVRRLAQPGRSAKLLAGGTDLQPGARQGIYQPDVMIDIARLQELRGIRIEPHCVTIGAGTTLADIVAHDALADILPMLREGLVQVATTQIRNVATLAGDLCQEKRCWFFRSGAQCYKNGGASCPCYAVLGDSRHHAIMDARRCAAPCVADAAPILVALDARVLVLGPQGKRSIPIESFYNWSGETTMARNEIMVQVEIPLPGKVRGCGQVFEKYAQWRGDFAEASVAVMLHRDGSRLASVRVALGAVSPLPVRAAHVERMLMTGRLDDSAIEAASRQVVLGALPLRDNAWKAELLVNLTRRALQRALA
ncbi:molybdopterin cofactor-binding domain-containing protein [Lacisediminimonas sp.]|uniref:molybdopterin cofactor-binding domain-containing protein n=1 Tax=Lacisediminimonas sp. TaxID=3060582 RepID=UPI002728C8F1|nr:molybdopterin cofactor-binding domain-containing protein [Lacisediminimonas sp.]MDO8300891.1 molybdopterin-dependent oxidoreductase [Lacisediminimonas sp.]